jgi:hypothetical protein
MGRLQALDAELTNRLTVFLDGAQAREEINGNRGGSIRPDQLIGRCP